jgi:hypothetical protein
LGNTVLRKQARVLNETKLWFVISQNYCYFNFRTMFGIYNWDEDSLHYIFSSGQIKTTHFAFIRIN